MSIVNVTLNVKGEVDGGAVMYVVGSCPQLGMWRAQDALLLEFQEQADDDGEGYVLVLFFQCSTQTLLYLS